MSRDGQRLIDYLTHILEAIGRIGRYTMNFGRPACWGRADMTNPS
jgi:hypothetical protein